METGDADFFPLETFLLEKRGKRPKRVGVFFKDNLFFVNGGGGKGRGKGSILQDGSSEALSGDMCAVEVAALQVPKCCKLNK